MTYNITPDALRSFSGSHEVYTHTAYPGIDYTEGVKFLLDNGAAWLVTDILYALLNNKRILKVPSTTTIIITLMVYPSGYAELEFDDGSVLLQKNIPFTDFPLQTVSFNYANHILCLPSEN